MRGVLGLEEDNGTCKRMRESTTEAWEERTEKVKSENVT